MTKPIPTHKTKAEIVRTVCAVVAALANLATLVIVVIVNFL